ncbi:nucleoside triphosphate hydrolase [Szabonella alba]|uniref:Nucleoside triphosphate hydrolase n=1 Tax=Szabonella alba TaxID=2804194 RepID=A0A8K0V5S8_9RHOB|nr:nucleoside triphosphate hydrolase [Szabonella alba]
MAHLLDRSLAAAQHHGAGRIFCAIAGPPASGKSTLAEGLTEALNRHQPGLAALLPMDGFHYDDLYLGPAGLRPRKGAPETFDVGGLRHALNRLRAREEETVAVPVFDRELEIARAGARLIAQTVQIILVEGNYLLLDRAPWDGLRDAFDVTVRIDPPEGVLRARLVARWQHHGLTPDAMAAKIDGNDLPNARLVTKVSREADFLLRQDR